MENGKFITVPIYDSARHLKRTTDIFPLLPLIHVPLNGFQFKELPLISDNVIRLPFTREPSSSVSRKK